MQTSANDTDIHLVFYSKGGKSQQRFSKGHLHKPVLVVYDLLHVSSLSLVCSLVYVKFTI